MRQTGDSLVTIVVRCPPGLGPRVLRDALEFFLRRCECEVVRMATRPADSRNGRVHHDE